MNVEESATGIRSASQSTTIGPHSDRSVAIASGRQSVDHRAQVRDLVRDRVDQPVAQDRQQRGRRPGATRRSPVSTARM